MERSEIRDLSRVALRSTRATKKALRLERLSFKELEGLLRRRIGGRAARGSIGFKLLAGFFRTLLQLFLQLLLGGLELLRIGRGAVIGFGELRERQRQCQRRAVGVDRLNNQVLSLLQVGDQFRRHLVVRHAAVLKTNHIGSLRRRVGIDNDTGTVHELHAQRKRDAENLLWIAFRFDDHGGNHGLTRFDAAVLAGEANLLGAGILTLQAEFGPRRVDQLNLVRPRLTARGGSRGGGRRGRGPRGWGRGRGWFWGRPRRGVWRWPLGSPRCARGGGPGPWGPE